MAAIIAASLGPAAQTPPEPTLQQRPPEGPTLTITSREVLLDVVAMDKHGRPIHGLKASDFRITEDGKPQQITSFEEHTAQAAASMPAPPQLPPNTFTNFQPVPVTNAYTAIVLDALDTRVDDQMLVRHELIKYLKKMQPGTPVAIFQMAQHLRLIQGFTTDPKVLLQAAESKRNMPSLLLQMEGNRDMRILITAETLQDQFRELGRYLAAFPGRKNLVWIFGHVPGTGFSGVFLGDEFSIGNPFADDFNVMGEDPSHLTDALTISRVSVYPIDARGVQAPGMFDAGQRSAPGTGNLMQWEAAIDSEHLWARSIAEATGGRAYFNDNGLDKQLEQIVDGGSNYYTIAYATTNQKWDGEFLHIGVTVDKPGVVLEHRPGYFAIDRSQQEQRQLAALRRKDLAKSKNYVAPAGAGANAGVPAPAQAQTASAPGAATRGPRDPLAAAMLFGGLPATQVVFAAHLTPEEKVMRVRRDAPLPPDNYLTADFHDKPFRKYIVSIRAETRDVHFTRGADGKRHGALQFVTVVYTPTGQQVNSKQTTATFDLSEAEYQKLLKQGLPGLQQIAIPVKGNYFLRIGVHDVASGKVGVLQIAADQLRPEMVAARRSGH
ncbi:MAG: VWA domain-containing protein [Acidobacteriota bacterium]